MRKWFVLACCLVLLLSSLALAGRAVTTTVAAGDSLPLQPMLLEWASLKPARPVQVIVQVHGEMDRTIQAAAALGGDVAHRWDFIKGFAVTLPADKVPQLAALPGVKWVSWNSGMKPAGKAPGGGGTTSPTPSPTTGAVDTTDLATAYPYAVRAADMWNAGFTGAGITVAVIDSGVTLNTASTADLSGRMLDSITFNSAATTTSDRFGHGTHVTGIVAGNGAYLSGKYIGIAPKATLLNVKFSADDGTGTEADLLNAMNWISNNRAKYNIRVVNLSSVSGTVQSYKTSPLAAGVEYLWKSGMVVVVAAGNYGTATGAIDRPPANDPYVITVGALDDKGTRDMADDVQTSWSSRGKTMDGFNKPDILAPGAHIISLKACDSCTINVTKPENTVDGAYFRMGGTSMAAPVVSGAIALMLEKNPSLTPDQIKWLLTTTGRKWTGMARTDAKALDAYTAAFYASTPGTANTGLTPSSGSNTSSTTNSTIYWSMSVDY